MKLNLKVRLRNKTFWLTAVPALITLIYAILALFNVVPAITEETVLRVVAAIFSVLTVLGVFVDPTTKGIGDSERAMGYERPFEDIEEDGANG